MHEESLQGDPDEDRRGKLHRLIDKHQALKEEMDGIEDEINALLNYPENIKKKGGDKDA